MAGFDFSKALEDFGNKVKADVPDDSVFLDPRKSKLFLRVFPNMTPQYPHIIPGYDQRNLVCVVNKVYECAGYEPTNTPKKDDPIAVFIGGEDISEFLLRGPTNTDQNRFFGSYEFVAVAQEPVAKKVREELLRYCQRHQSFTQSPKENSDPDFFVNICSSQRGHHGLLPVDKFQVVGRDNQGHNRYSHPLSVVSL